MTATHSPQNIRFIRAGAVPTHNLRKEDNSACSCNSRFQTEMATKRQNLRTAALNKGYVFDTSFLTEWFTSLIELHTAIILNMPFSIND